MFVLPPGTYSGAGAGLCSPCPAGKSCADPSVTPVDCANGYYSTGGTVSGFFPCTWLIIKNTVVLHNLPDVLYNRILTGMSK